MVRFVVVNPVGQAPVRVVLYSSNLNFPSEQSVLTFSCVEGLYRQSVARVSARSTPKYHPRF